MSAAAGSSGAGAGSADLITVDTLECAGGFPSEDVSGAAHAVSVSGELWGALPHFWDTYGLGRLGLYLDNTGVVNHEGRNWGEVLREHTVDAVQNLGLKSVRGHGLFHDDIGIYHEENDTPVYDFTNSDKIFDFLTENGIAPIVELASMPSDLAADPSQTVFDWNMIVSPPKDYQRWGDLVQAFTAHSVERYGADVVSTWYFEVWNEPECCQGKFWKGTLSDYFQLYDYAAAGVRAALPGGRVGGPVSSQAVELRNNSMAGVQFLDHVTTDNFVTPGSPGTLDFFSFHTWAFIDGAVGGYFEGLDLLDSYGLGNVPIAVTEFGPTWEFGLRGVGTETNPEPVWEPQETGQGATFVAQAYANIAQRCAKEGKRFPIAYAWWTLSDVFDEGYEDPADYVLEDNPFIGAMGLINREGIHKPAYNAYKFLAQMGHEQLALNVTGLGNAGGMASRNESGGVQVLIYNGQEPGRGYQDDTYYKVTEAQEIGVTVTGLNPAMAYNVTAYRIDEGNGNSFATWDGMGRPTMDAMSEADWQTLRGSMDSQPEVLGQAVCGDRYSQKFSLSSPGVLFVTLEPAVAP